MLSKQEIVNLYNNGMSAYDIQKLTNYKSVNSIYNILRKETSMRSKAGNKNPNLIHNYFEKIDSERKAYFLGFIFADGNITLRKNSQSCIAIEIKNYDSYILEIFKQELKTDNTIESTRKDCKRIRIHSDKMQQDLEKYNIIPDKCHKHNQCIILEEPFMSHFIRGMYDGDGWISQRQSSKRLTFGLCGTYESIDSIKNYLINKLELSNVQTNNYLNKIPFFTFQKQSDVEKIYHYLYDNATIYLTRKKDIFNKVYTEVNNS